MSFDDYADHIYQKHRLAVALAIIKSKPTNVPTIQYLEELKSKIDDKMDDDDVTICSDDFLTNDDDDEMNNSVTILKDFDPGNIETDIGNGCELIQAINNTDKCIRKNNDASVKPTVPGDQSQSTFYNSLQTQFTPTIAYISNNSTHYADLNSDLDIELPITTNTIHKDITNAHSNKGLFHEDFEPNSANLDATYYDSQKTIPYTVHGFPQNYTHYSSSQTDIIIPNKLIYGTDRNKCTKTVENNKENDERISRADNNNSKVIHAQGIDELCFNKDSSNNIISNDNIHEKPQDFQDLQYSQTMNIFSENNDDHFNVIQDNFLNSNTHLSNKNNTITNEQNTNTENMPQYSQNVDEYFEEMQTLIVNEHGNSFHKKTKNVDFEQYSKSTNIEMTNVFPHNVDILSQNTENINTNEPGKATLKLTDIRKTINDKLTISQNKNQFSNNANCNPNTDVLESSENNNSLAMIDDKNDFHGQYNTRTEEYEMAEDERDTEIISYKVLEELNKVKTFLRKQNIRLSCDGYSTDSGYRSDSQIKNSNRSALQLSGNWLDQSGCCLFNYIMQCPLLVSTRDITYEIAQVLSQLIDKLHEEERYPSFLEDLLETVDLLLRQVYEGESSGDGEILKKDENIQRILLLNKSIHIQKYSIEKITHMLESFHSKVIEKDSTYELTNINQIENMCYIFHVLEILLKKYLKCKDLLSQSSTQFSQDEERIFKKSSISNIWRKKWNPNPKTCEGSKEKKCVVKMCSEVLNKIVINCMTSYSLVAYSALKCFNCMQS